jgi:hypothetical protein
MLPLLRVLSSLKQVLAAGDIKLDIDGRLCSTDGDNFMFSTMLSI